MVGGVGATAQGGQSPLEKMFSYDGNFDRKGRPRASLTAYLAGVDEAMQAVVQDLKRGMSAKKDW